MLNMFHSKTCIASTIKVLINISDTWNKMAKTDIRAITILQKGKLHVFI